MGKTYKDAKGGPKLYSQKIAKENQRNAKRNSYAKHTKYNRNDYKNGYSF